MRSGVVKHVKEVSHLMSDEATALAGLEAIYKRSTFSHKKDQYGDGAGGHTNTIEGVWALIKRQIYGIHHFVSAKHLHRYFAEATWRYNLRGMMEVPRMATFITRTDGRLMYKTLIAKM
jgi:hypothetical protein